MLYKTFYTDKFVQKNHAASTRGCFIFIRPKYKDDFGLHEHEKLHVAQFWRLPVIYSILYNFNKSYRLKSEIEAYKKQLEYCENKEHSIELFSHYISSNYGIIVNEEDVKKQLLEGL